MYAVFTSSEKSKRSGGWSGTSNGCRRPNAVGSFSRHGAGRGCRGLYAVAPSQDRCAYFMGTRPPVASRKWQAVPRGDWHTTPDHHGRPVARHGRFVGDGRRIAMPCIGRRHRRGLGRPACVGFYGDQTPRYAERSRVRAVLVDPARGRHQPECGAQSLARVLAPLRAQPARRTSTGFATLVAGSVPLTSPQTRIVGGGI